MLPNMKYWTFLLIFLYSNQEICRATSQNATNNTQKDRRYVIEPHFDAFPLPPSRPSLTARPLQDLALFSHSSISSTSPSSREINLEPTIKSKGHPTDPTPSNLNFNNKNPNFVRGNDDLSLFSSPSGISKENQNRHEVTSSSEASFRVNHNFNYDDLGDFPIDLARRPLLPYHERFPPELNSDQHLSSPPPFNPLRSSTSSSTIIPGSKSSPPIFIPGDVSSSSSHPPDLLPSLIHQSISPDYIDNGHRDVSNHHMPLITSVDVQCSMTAMHVHLKFDGPFGGVVYSKGFYNDPKCHYVPFGTGLNSYEFVIAINRCGAQFVDFTPGGHASLEDIIVVQNEQSIQEVWDTARRLQCTWAGTFERKVNSAFHVDMLETVAVTYNADTANAYMDIQLGKGPFAAPVTGLVKIGDTITVVIAVEAPGDVDVRVKECVAHNGDNVREDDNGGFRKNSNNLVHLTDTDGCVLKPKLMSPWHKTRDTGKTGASVLTYSYLQAFKFPDRMEVYLECSLEICKQHCQERCRGEEDSGETYTVSRLKRDNMVKSKLGGEERSKEHIVVQRTLRVVSPEDLSLLRNGTEFETEEESTDNRVSDICLSIAHFAISVVMIFFILIASCVTTGVIVTRRGYRKHLVNKSNFIETLSKT